MPSFSKIFKLRRVASTINESGGLEDSNFAQVADSHYSPLVSSPDLRRGVSLPQPIVAQKNDFSQDLNAFPGVLTIRPGNLQMPAGPAPDSKLLPPTPSSPRAISPHSGVSDGMEGMWHGINDRDAHISKTEKVMNKISDTAGALSCLSLMSTDILQLA